MRYDINETFALFTVTAMSLTFERTDNRRRRHYWRTVTVELYFDVAGVAPGERPEWCWQRALPTRRLNAGVAQVTADLVEQTGASLGRSDSWTGYRGATFTLVFRYPADKPSRIPSEGDVLLALTGGLGLPGLWTERLRPVVAQSFAEATAAATRQEHLRVANHVFDQLAESIAHEAAEAIDFDDRHAALLREYADEKRRRAAEAAAELERDGLTFDNGAAHPDVVGAVAVALRRRRALAHWGLPRPVPVHSCEEAITALPSDPQPDDAGSADDGAQAAPTVH